MATDIELNAKINTANSAQALGELRKSLKDLIDLQATVSDKKSFAKLSAAINETEGKIGDLTDSFQTLKGSGVDRLTSSTGLLKEGFEKFDTGKIGAGLKGLGAAFKAIPIFLVIEGVQYLIENFEKLTNSGGIVGDVFSAISDGIGYAVQKLKDFADWIGVADFKATAFAENQIKQAKEAKDAVGERYDYEIAKANAAGKAVEGLEREKAIASRKAIDAEMNAIVKLSNVKGKLSEEDEKRLKELGKERVKTLQAEELANIKFVKNIDEAIVKQTEKEKEELKKRNEDYKKSQEEKKRLQKELADKEQAQRLLDLQKAKEDENAILLQTAQALYLDTKANDEINQADKDSINAAIKAKEYEDAENDRKRKKAQRYADLRDDVDAINKKLEFTKNGLQAAQSISDLFFSIKMANTKKGSVEEEKAARKQFIINKAAAISSTILNGIQGGLTAFAKNPPPSPIGIISASLVGLGTAAAVAKIAATQFNNTGFASEDKGSVSLGGAISGGSGGSIAPPPTVQPQQQNVTTFTGNNNNNFNQQPIKTYVVETDLRNSTNTIDKIREQATF